MREVPIKSSYQKLKTENAKLKAEIAFITTEETIEDFLMRRYIAKTRNMLNKQLEDTIWHGNPTTENRNFGGLLNKLQ